MSQNTDGARVWTVSPQGGGRMYHGAELAGAFRELGCEAEEVFQSQMERRRDDDRELAALQTEVLESIIVRASDTPPDLLVDFVPLPEEIHRFFRDLGCRTVYWLLEDGRKDEYGQWKDIGPVVDRFFTFQGEPFDPESGEYLPWGAPFQTRQPVEPRREVLVHGTASPKRKQFASSFCQHLGGLPETVRIVGPRWSEWEFYDAHPWDLDLRVEDRWTRQQETSRLIRGRVVVAPPTVSLNAVLPRHWLCLGIGSCLLVEGEPVFTRHLDTGTEIETFDNPEEAASLAADYVQDPSRARARIEAGRAAVKQRHHLKYRAREILNRLVRNRTVPEDVP